MGPLGPEEAAPAELTPDHWQTLQRTVQVRVLRYFRRHGLLEDTTTADMLTWQGTGGFSIDASVRIELLYRLPGPTPDGRTVLLLSPLELLQRLARLVPPPRMHRHRYHGVLAPNARLRPQVVAIGRSEADDAAQTATGEEDETVESTPSHLLHEKAPRVK